MNIVVHRYDHADSEVRQRLIRLEVALKGVVAKQERLMIDTSKLLAAVAEEKTETASLRALADALTTAMKDLSAQLAAAIAANDPVAIAQVQKDLDQATAELSTDSQATKDAVAANTPPSA